MLSFFGYLGPVSNGKLGTIPKDKVTWGDFPFQWSDKGLAKVVSQLHIA